MESAPFRFEHVNTQTNTSVYHVTSTNSVRSATTTINKFYSVENPPPVLSGHPGDRNISVTNVLFSFEDGKFTSVLVHGVPIKKDGELGLTQQYVAGFYAWNQDDWPDWMKEIFIDACDGVSLSTEES